MKNKIDSNNGFKVTGIPSKPGQPESGRIIVKGPGVYKEIPAVIFTPRQTKELSDIAEKYYRESAHRKL